MRKRSMQESDELREWREGRGPKPDSPISLGRHERKCEVCNHPDREAIEQEFLRWYAVEDIAIDHDIANTSSIYRHAHASGLFEQRHRMIRVALEPLIEQATCVKASASTIISAVRTYARVNSAGEWISARSKAQESRRSRATGRRRAAGRPSHSSASRKSES
jgi:hypothetical protein